MSIISTTSTIRLNLRLVQASQFLQQFKLDVYHKPEKEHIIPNALSCLASANNPSTDARYPKLDALFVHNRMLIKIHPMLVSRILAGYNADPWWAWLRLQIQHNIDLDTNAAALLFLLGSVLPIDANSYINLRPKSNESPVTNRLSIQRRPAIDELPALNKSKLLYYVNKLTGVCRL